MTSSTEPIDPLEQTRRARLSVASTLVDILRTEPLRVGEFDAIDKAIVRANGSGALLERAEGDHARLERDLAEEERKARRVVRAYPRAGLSEQGLV